MDNNSLASARKPVKVLDGIPMFIVCAAVIVVLIIIGSTGILTNNGLRYFFKIFLYIVMGSMWNLMSGFTGMTSLGQQVFVGLAGYSVCIMTSFYNMSFWMGILLGAVVGALFALLLSFVLFRMRGMYFAVATWLIAEAVRLWFNSWDYVKMGVGLTVKTNQIPKIQPLYFYALALMVITIIVIYGLLRTKTGLALTSMRDETDAASSVGVNIFKTKLICYVLASLFIALAGALFFLNKGSVIPSSGFSIDWTVSMVFIVILGGSGTMTGPIVGSVIYVLLDEFLSHYPGWSNIILGVLAILVILFLPKGIMGTLQSKLNFEIFSAKRLSEPKRAAKAKAKEAA
jgi:branched-chain amino acid transport system permease protein